MSDPDQIKVQLPHTWSPFFARHGSLTPVQQQAIPLILAGHNTLVVAPTASGKTEAVIAPLLERHVLGPEAPRSSGPEQRILYICPTRALVRDLYERLAAPLAQLGVALGMKSGDTGPVSISRPPTVLITTPESTDSLLTRAPRLLAPLSAIVLDEIHLFDRSVRGDHLRCLLRRIESIRRHSQQEAGIDPPVPWQRIALSATIPDPAGAASRYLADEEVGDVKLVEAGGSRRIEAELQPMHGLDDLVTELAQRAGERLGIRKTLIFCNTRNEVEQVAAYLRQHLPYEATVFVHYSNLDPALRREVEEGFAQASVAICVASSTLELGIDIGSIDDVALVGPPPTLISFLQRIGRGGRRTGVTQVLCLPRTALEQVRFAALVDLVEASGEPAFSPATLPSLRPPSSSFRPSVLVQQVFSILKQSPTGGIRLADLLQIAPVSVADEALRRILDHLTAIGFLRKGGLGEWRPAQRLHELADAHEIYSNIGADPLAMLVVDAFSGRTIAQTGRMRSKGERFLMGGRVLEVVWRDRYRMGVRPAPGQPAEETLRFLPAPFAVPLDVSQAVGAYLGMTPGQLALVHDEKSAVLFHFWGDLYGALLGAMLQDELAPNGDGPWVTRLNEHCLRLPAGLSGLQPWSQNLAHQEAQRLMPRLQPYLELGRFHSLLPPDLAYQAALAQCDLPRFEQLYRSAIVVSPPAGLRTRLLDLVR
ncbi:MAG: DEAD/DEAH box helicase [Chloroflexota bacterium]|nr:DEAD/DEAH box helicase [Chloroflexota bacterium]